MSKLGLKLLSIAVWTTLLAGAREYHVSVTGNDKNDGTAASPFKTISCAARIAQPGDEIIVHAGVYRERVNPARGGESDTRIRKGQHIHGTVKAMKRIPIYMQISTVMIQIRNW